MKIISLSHFNKLPKIDCLICFTFKNFNIKELNSNLKLNENDTNCLQQIVNNKNFRGKENETIFLPLPLTHYGAIYIIGLGDNSLSLNSLRELWGKKIEFIKNEKFDKVAFWGLDSTQSLALGEVTLLSFYDFNYYKTKKNSHSLAKLILCTQIKASNIKKLEIQCTTTNWARDLINTPAKDLTPSKLALISKDMAKTFQLDYEILGEKEMKALGMGALQAVSLGSPQEAKLIILKYKSKKANQHIALVGKGVTFDSGGLSLKPNNAMIPMKTDMAGAATVLGAFRNLVELKPNVNITCVIPTTENMIDGKSIKLGDVIKAYNGKTIEIHNSDAEGRLILADALAYTEDKIAPDIIVDVATLTGAVKVCLGNQHAGLITHDNNLAKQLKKAGEQTNEPLWQLPLTKYHQNLMKGNIADLCNVASKPVAGTSTAAAFLENFVEKTTWAHIDIAGVAREFECSYLSHHGATGFGVRLLSQWILNLDN